jgi:hypothetical protein
MEHISEILPAIIIKRERKPLSPIRERLLSMPSEDECASIVFQHSVLRQTCMPYRDPGETKIWQRKNGFIRMELLAGRVLDPYLDDVV